MKRKTVNNRRNKSAKYFELGETSKYGQKITQQKKGNFSINSPFICNESNSGIPLHEFNKRRFKKII
jgi:hypothetical protein